MKLLEDAKTIRSIPDQELIETFKIKNKNKIRTVNNPHPMLKTILKEWNIEITNYYEQQLDKNKLNDIAHAYLPNKSIRTNAEKHRNNDIIQFDFKGFYDHCRFEYFEKELYKLDKNLNTTNIHLVKRLLINPATNGITQGLPVSGALAGISLIPFWKILREKLPKEFIVTQYSDDLTISCKHNKHALFNIKSLTEIIEESLQESKRDFKLNDEKTRKETKQYRKITGVRINHENKMTPSRNDYRFLRHVLYILSKSDDLDNELEKWNMPSRNALIGKINYMRSIDETGKCDQIINKYANTCIKHNIFTTWIKDKWISPFT